MRQVCVIGLGQFGSHLARQLVKLGCEVLAIDASESRVELVRDDVHQALIGDARNFDMLDSVISDTLDEAIIALGERIEPSVLCALHLRQLEVEVIRSTASNEDHAQILRAVGATDIIFPEQATAERVARRIANPALLDMFSLEGDYRIMEIAAPESIHGKSLADMNLRQKYGLLVLGIRDPGEEHYRFLPEADEVFRPDQALMVLGRELELTRFSNGQ